MTLGKTARTNPVGEPVNQSSRRRTLARIAREVGWAFLFATIVAVLWVTNSGLWSAAAWQIPAIYHGDGLQILGWIQAAAEGDYQVLGTSFISRLGAPFEANWNDYPMYEKPFCILLGYVARICGLYVAANIGMLFTHMSAAMGFYLAARWLRWNRWWSGVAAVVFALQYYLSFRGLGHLLLALPYALPFALLGSWLITRDRDIRHRSGNWWLCVVTGFVMGASNPYFLYIYLQLIVLALFAQILRGARRANLSTGAWTIAAAAVGFLVVHTGKLMIRLLAGPNMLAVHRHYGDSEIFALRPLEMLLPFAQHRFEPFARIGREYQNVLTYSQPESGAPYLGVIGVGLLIALLTVAIRGAVRGSSKSPVQFWQSLWVIGFSVVGGGNALLFLFGVDVFRASNRNSIFISALLLMWIVPHLTRWTRSWKPLGRIALGTVMILFAAWDQLPGSGAVKRSGQIARQIELDREFATALELKLSDDAMVFQFPTVKFPEARLINGRDAYSHSRLFLNSRKLRLSFGSNKGRMDASWQANVERLAPREMILQLEAYGFRVMVVDRAALDGSGAAFLSTLAAMGYPAAADLEHPQFVAVPLRPVAEPALPDLNQFSFLDYDDGWERIDVDASETHWLIENEARLRLNPNLPIATPLRLSFSIRLPKAGVAQVYLGGKVLTSIPVEAGQFQSVVADFERPDREMLLTIAARLPDNSDKIDDQITLSALTLKRR